MPEYELIRSRRKTLCMEIKPDGRVVVRAPLRTSQREIRLFVEKHRDWLDTHMEQVQRRRLAHPEPDKAEEMWLRALAKEILPQRVAYYAPQMGVEPNGISITGARTRFGSCSPKNHINFSWRLMTYPDEAIDYVVVHELAHIRHKNHSRQFHDFVGSILPDHKERRKLLRQ